MQSRTNSTLKLYNDGFSVGPVSVRLSNAVLNIRDICALGIGVGAFSFLRGAQTSCGYCTTSVDEVSYVQDQTGASYRIARTGCDVPIAGSFDIRNLTACGDVNITHEATAASYIELATYYCGLLKLASSQIANITVIECIKDYLSHVEAYLISADQAALEAARQKKAQEDNITEWKMVGGVLGAALVSGLGLFAAIKIAKKCKKDSNHKEEMKEENKKEKLANA